MGGGRMQVHGPPRPGTSSPKISSAEGEKPQEVQSCSLDLPLPNQTPASQEAAGRPGEESARSRDQWCAHKCVELWA